MKAKNSLNPDALVAHAITIVDAEGLDALTIRKVADAFGVTPMALYWHFANKEALLAAVGDAVVSGVRVPAADLGLEEYLAEAMNALVDAMRAHPGAADVFAQRFLLHEDGREITEHTLELLRQNGFGVDHAASVVHYAMQLAISMVSREPGAENGIKPAERDDVRAQKRAALEALPVDRYPRLRESAEAMTSCGDLDGYYDTGITIFIAGVMAEARSLANA